MKKYTFAFSLFLLTSLTQAHVVLLDPAAAAAHLFERLHELEAALISRAVPAARIIAAPYPEGGLGSAIADRLRRAAATPQ